MHIIITGASRGIGRDLALALARSGHTLTLIARNKAALEQVTALCNGETGKNVARAYPFDLSDLSQLEGEFLSGLKAPHGVDALVNNAAGMLKKAFDQVSGSEAKSLFDANFFAPATLARLCKPLMMDSPLKHVVNIGSMAGFQGSGKFAGLSYYSASKAALSSLSECLAVEWKQEGIKVNTLALGAVQTDMLGEAFPGLKAPVEAADMASFIQWFILEGGKYFNGKVLPVSVATP